MNYNKSCLINTLFFSKKKKYSNNFLNFKKKILILIKMNKILLNILPIKLRSLCKIINFYEKIIVIEIFNINCKFYLFKKKKKILNKFKSIFLPNLIYFKIKINYKYFYN